MKTFYRLIKNRRAIAENENLDLIKEVARVDSRVQLLVWKDFSDENIFYQCAFCPGTVQNGRIEYEIEVVKKRA